jgi:hypothetical protein
VLTDGRRRTTLGSLLRQFRDFMIPVLLVAGVTSGLIGEAEDTSPSSPSWSSTR